MPPRKIRRTKSPSTAEHQAQDFVLSEDKKNTANGNDQKPISSDSSRNLDNADDNVDTALLDEEVVPDTNSPAKHAVKSAAQFMSGYNALKSFNGQVYSGMAIGGSHTWNYDSGIWKETKVEPDMWQIDYKTKKRRAKNAPTGSGATVGTEYHWLIVSHQYVKKIDANTYETHLVGSKYKLAHKNANSTSWSINTVKAQREHELELLDDAKRRVQGLPPVSAAEKVKVERHEKGQQSLDAMFGKKSENGDIKAGEKRKRET